MSVDKLMGYIIVVGLFGGGCFGSPDFGEGIYCWLESPGKVKTSKRKALHRNQIKAEKAKSMNSYWISDSYTCSAV